METRELKERMGLELGGWGWINRQQDIKTGLRDGVGMEERRVVGVIGGERRRRKRRKTRSIVKKKKKKRQQQSRERKTVWKGAEPTPETGVIKGVKGVCI